MLKMNILYVALLLCFIHQVLGSSDPSDAESNGLGNLPNLADLPPLKGEVLESRISELEDNLRRYLEEEDIQESSTNIGGDETFALVEVDNGIKRSRKLKLRKFGEVVRSGDMNTAWGIFNSDDDHVKRSCGDHLISLGKDRLIEIINVTEDPFKPWMFRMILEYVPDDNTSLFDAVVEAVKPGNAILSGAAYSDIIASRPKKFVHLLKKIDKEVYQQRAVENAVIALYHFNKTENIELLHSAIEEETCLNQGLGDVAHRKATEIAVEGKPSSSSYIAMRRFNYYSATPTCDYVIDLRHSFYNLDPTKESLYWLLKRAGRLDLEVAKISPEYSSNVDIDDLDVDNPSVFEQLRETAEREDEEARKYGPEVSKFMGILENALMVPDIEPRIGMRDKAAMMEKTLTIIIPLDLIRIILEYFHVDAY